jgi:hypothetical protein
MSTWPRERHGQVCVCLIAITHGMTSQMLTLPDEDAEAYDLRLVLWTAGLRPCNPFEEAMVRPAVESSWRLDGADRVWAAALSERIDAEAGDEEDQARSDPVGQFGCRLWARPSERRTALD